MSKTKIIIIDDEPLAIDVLTNYLKHFPNFEIVKTFTQPIEALKYLNEHHIDLVFSDIAMPNISGTELIKLTKSKTKFVMVTSYSEYAIESFELDVLDYLLKPVSLERFKKTIKKFEDNIKFNTPEKQNPESSFFIKEGDEFTKVMVKDIDYIEGMKDYSKIVCGKNYYLALKSLKSIEEAFYEYNFMRIHKSFIVPLNKVLQFNTRFVLINKHEIPVGYHYRKYLKEYLLMHKL